MDSRLRTALRSPQGPHDEARALWERLRAGTIALLDCPHCDGSGQSKHLAYSEGGQCQPEWVEHPCDECEGTGKRPPRETVQLLAYVGHPGARVLEPCCSCDVGPIEWGRCRRTKWLNGLIAYGRDIPLQAAIAVARASVDHWDVIAESEASLATALNVLSLAETWLETRDPNDVELWAEEADRVIGTLFIGKVPHPSSDFALVVHSNALLIGEGAAKKAMLDEFTRWALGD